MGFFSSRKTGDDYQFTISTASDPRDKSVVQVIRSRFYGKNKGKEREGRSPTTFTTHTSVAQTLAGSSSTSHVPLTSSPLSNRSNTAKSEGPSTLRPQLGRSNLSAPSKARSAISLPPSPTMRSRNGEPPPVPPKDLTTPSPRKPTDAVTYVSHVIFSNKPCDALLRVTLAQRLNELAVANSEGLLNDDEYRLLRQNLFERFADSATVPKEVSIIPEARVRPRGNSGQDRRPLSRPLSNFEVEVPRPPSVNSRSSVTASMSSLLRRATSGRRKSSASKDFSDTSSMISTRSTTSNIFKRRLSKKSSNASVRTTTSRTQADSVSISSRQTGVGSDRTPSDHLHQLSPGASRSVASIRRYATPPSSFPAKIIGAETRYVGVNDIYDEDNLKSSKDISQEILAVEAEAKRVMDAFNGLELTTLTKVQRRHVKPHIRHATDDGRSSRAELAWNSIPDDRSQRRINITQGDSSSVKSAASGGTHPSMPRSTHTGTKALRPKGSLNASISYGPSSRAGSVHRKNSVSSIGSQDYRGSRGGIPPIPSLPSSAIHGQFTGSSVSLARSMGIVHEDSQSMSVENDEEDRQTENELDHIRRRREDVYARYEARLEYLRARLKGAQLHEKVLKK